MQEGMFADPELASLLLHHVGSSKCEVQRGEATYQGGTGSERELVPLAPWIAPPVRVRPGVSTLRSYSWQLLTLAYTTGSQGRTVTAHRGSMR